MIVVAPNFMSSSKQIAAPGPPIPWDTIESSAPSNSTLKIRYSRFQAISYFLSHKSAATSVLKQSPIVNTTGLMTPRPTRKCGAL